MSLSKRDHLVDTAAALFYRDGFHATGIDRILGEAGVAKMTLYNHFKSKDELILAALRHRGEEFRTWFMRTVELHAKKPRKRLLAIFEILEEWFETDEFAGCLFISSFSEFHDVTHPVHQISAEHKQQMQAYVRELAKDAGADDPDDLAAQLGLLIEGAIVMAHASGTSAPARQARKAAKTLIAQAGV